MLQDNPSLLNIDLGQCLAWKKIREIPLEEPKGFSPLGVMLEEVAEGPDLSMIGGFFGLDETQTALLGDALKRFGERIRNVETETEQVEYHGDGTMRFTFPGGGEERRAAFNDLEQDMHAVLGAQDAVRLWSLSSLAQSAEDADAGINAYVTVSAEWVRSGLVNVIENISPRGRDPKPGEQMNSLAPGLGGDGPMRVRHLHHRIDWTRLYTEAVEKPVEK